MSALTSVVLPLLAAMTVLRRLPTQPAVSGERRSLGIAAVGATIRTAIDRTATSTPALHRSISVLDDRRLALVTCAAIGTGLLRWWAPPTLILIALGLGGLSARRSEARLDHARADAAPLLVDVLRAAIATGANPRAALQRLGVADLPAGLAPLRAVLQHLAADLREGAGFDAAVDRLASVHESLRPLADVLRSSERLGVAVLPALDVLAVDARLARRRRAEARARRLPVLLLFPLVVCTLPAFALLTVVPLLLSGLSSVRW